MPPIQPSRRAHHLRLDWLQFARISKASIFAPTDAKITQASPLTCAESPAGFFCFQAGSLALFWLLFDSKYKCPSTIRLGNYLASVSVVLEELTERQKWAKSPLFAQIGEFGGDILQLDTGRFVRYAWASANHAQLVQKPFVQANARTPDRLLLAPRVARLRQLTLRHADALKRLRLPLR